MIPASAAQTVAAEKQENKFTQNWFSKSIKFPVQVTGVTAGTISHTVGTTW